MVLKDYLYDYSDDNGCCCRYFALGKIGAKVYPGCNKETVEEIFLANKKAYKAGLAPKVYSVFRIKTDRGYVYGYYVEHISTILGNLKPSERNKLIYKREKLEEDLYKLATENDCSLIELASVDLHYYNIGIKKNKLVCIDFG
jgi:hypothetical protein